MTNAMPLTDLSASALSALIRRGDVSSRELMQATLARIAQVNPIHNAIVSLRDADELLREADARDAQRVRGDATGWLHGIPQAIKDIAPTAGLRSMAPDRRTSISPDIRLSASSTTMCS